MFLQISQNKRIRLLYEQQRSGLRRKRKEEEEGFKSRLSAQPFSRFRYRCHDPLRSCNACALNAFNVRVLSATVVYRYHGTITLSL